VLGEEVGEVEGAGLVVVERGEALGPGEELVAVGAGEPLDARACRRADERVEQPPVPQSA
jgi:hypothetical protein